MIPTTHDFINHAASLSKEDLVFSKFIHHVVKRPYYPQNVILKKMASWFMVSRPTILRWMGGKSTPHYLVKKQIAEILAHELGIFNAYKAMMDGSHLDTVEILNALYVPCREMLLVGAMVYDRSVVVFDGDLKPTATPFTYFTDNSVTVPDFSNVYVSGYGTELNLGDDWAMHANFLLQDPRRQAYLGPNGDH